ncbi:MAG TPA: polysaccharide biosynthesis tyrosine autokinase, partial [Flavisolibacter sp.]|nr:polysaccharide biosynthesis tyrosine autokinase [Flavisolibacter sp.]
SIDLFAIKKTVENEIEVLKSWSLMDEVAKSLHLYAPIYEEGKFRNYSAYLTSPVTIEVNHQETVAPVEKAYISFNHKTSTVILDNKHYYDLNKWVKTPYGTLRFTSNKQYQKPDDIRPLFFTIVKPEALAKSLTADLGVSAVSKESSVIKLSFKDEVPKKAEDILNELINAYNNLIITDKKILASKTFSFVDDRMNVVAKELDSIENQIQQYKSGSGAIDINTQGTLFLESMSANTQKLSELNSSLSVLNQVEKMVLAKNKGGSIVPSTLAISDPVLSNMLDKLYESELEYERLKGTVGEGHPLLTSINDQIEKIKPNILENIQSQKNSILASKAILASTNNRYNSMLQTIPQKEKNLLEISRDQTIKSSIYSFLLQKREESAISIASTVSDMRVVDQAQASDSPVSPKKAIIYAISVIAAIVLVIGIISTKEALSRKLLYRHEIESFTTMPIIGEITYKKSDQLLVVEEGKRSLLAEEFRKIRVSLPYIGVGANSKKILVTSNISGEGKSFVAANLAQTLALTGKKVVLVDMDLHNPSLGRVMSITPDQMGVSNYLAGESSFSDIVTKTTFNSNLSFVSAGVMQINPSELLYSERLKEFIEYLENTFDYVIIDSAPVVPISDAYVLSSYCDATLFVVRHKYTPKMLVQRLDESVKVNPLKNPAIIFNSVHNRGLTSNNYGYGYGYGYIYYKEVGGEKKPKALT